MVITWPPGFGFDAPAGYAFAWLDFPDRDNIFLVFRHVLPLGRPAIASLAIFQFL